MRKPRDEALLKALAAEVKARRQSLGFSQQELAFRTDVDRTFIGKIEVACVFRLIVTTDFGIVTGHFGDRDRQ